MDGQGVQAAKYVLWEKPLALSLAEVVTISAAAEKYGKVVVEAFIFHTHPQTLKVQEIVAGSNLGKVKQVRGSFTYMTPSCISRPCTGTGTTTRTSMPSLIAVSKSRIRSLIPDYLPYTSGLTQFGKRSPFNTAM